MSYDARRAFAPLRGLEWLTPSLSNVDVKVMLLGILGDFAIPLACLAFALWSLWRADSKAEALPPHSLSPLAAVLSVLFVLFVLSVLFPRPTREQFTTRITEKTAAYASHTAPANAHLVDALTLAYAWITLWTLAAARPAAATSPPAP
jgi:hypothetical protein